MKYLRLSPAYDLISTVLIIPEDKEESELTINGKKSHLKTEDFIALAESFGISQPATLRKFQKSESEMYNTVDSGRLPSDMKESLKAYIGNRMKIFLS